jgi:hypothetical protein
MCTRPRSRPRSKRTPTCPRVAVVGIEDAELGERARAFVVRRPGISADEDTLKAWCRNRLAGFKVPRDFVFLDALPRNPTGKVLKRDLRSYPVATASPDATGPHRRRRLTPSWPSAGRPRSSSDGTSLSGRRSRGPSVARLPGRARGTLARRAHERVRPRRKVNDVVRCGGGGAAGLTPGDGDRCGP